MLKTIQFLNQKSIQRTSNESWSFELSETISSNQYEVERKKKLCLLRKDCRSSPAASSARPWYQWNCTCLITHYGKPICCTHCKPLHETML